ncbi:Hypothetical predicted protein [Mytilus galloprovincialis]|uniref:Uncharacterized protein n=1 Tax=Mytilus galloprovincialis TaxID=29158 RepID=A0A8B6FGH1_MYTGA|nr:Hypothetical predicted protein [Mytilus galloprovincialis]
MMKTLFIGWFYQLVVVTLVYELRCPAPGHWRLRARKFYCGQSYVCLLRSPENSYRETCDGLDYSSTGSKLIFEPYFNKARCSYKRYQPFPFSTDGNNKCVYQKSFCNEEGQIVHREGSMINDTTCGCDSSQGYIFVIKPEHNCYCIPSKEDCTCHKLSCNDKDTLCPFIGSAVRNVSCPKIVIRPSTQKNESSTSVDRFTDGRSSYYKGRKYRLTCFYFIIALIDVMITELAVIGLSEWPDVLYRYRSTDNNTPEQLLVDQRVSGNSLNETEGDSIEIERLQKEKNRILMGELLSGDENSYNKFLTFLKGYPEYYDLIYGIENTVVTDEDRIAFQNCQRNTEHSR